MSCGNTLDWAGLSLDDGRVLIEASAGTGKTWTIGAIFLRLLLERELAVEQILVVTFTDAAAQELRERLRRRLADAERWLGAILAEQVLPDDEVAAWMAQAFNAVDKATAALRRIRIARMDFDRAPVATIHAICQRIQNDFPLEAGAAFAADKRLDEDALLRECLDDFWRQRYLADAQVNAAEADAVLDEGPQGLLFDVRSLLNHDVEVLPADGLDAIARAIRPLQDKTAIARLERFCDPALYKRKDSAVLTRMRKIVAALASSPDVAAELQANVDDNFDDEALDKAQPDSAELRLRGDGKIRALQDMRSLLAQRKVFVRGKVLAAAYAFCRRELPLRALRRQGQTFSMLIDAVHTRVTAGDAALADCLHRAFPALLIDEFQDTDARQFAIFDRVCRNARGKPRGLLVLIGDPKQAIYGFRGGDIATYLRVRETIAQRFDLTRNFRSSTPLVAACNALYAAADDAFDDTRVAYLPVQASGSADQHPFTRDGRIVDQPFAIHRFHTDGDGKAKDAKIDAALSDCAARIVEMLDDTALRIGGEPVRPGDIAVLLPNNRHIGLLRELLRALGVPCTGSGNDSVFESDTARELQLVLHAALHPHDDRAARAALTTTLLGKQYADLRAWQEDAAAFERELDRIGAWHTLLRSRGAMGVVAALLDARAADLLALPDGERIVADLRQLGELLAERERSESGAEGLLAWLAAMRRDDKGMEVASGHRVRSESGASCVRLMTLHAAKGLQFPVVFLPLAWFTSSRDKQFAPNVLHFHDTDGKACADIGSVRFAENRGAHFDEDLRERLRLLYVAITRAQYAVHLYWTSPAPDPDRPRWQVAAIDVLLQRAAEKFKLDFADAGMPALAQKLAHVRIVEPCMRFGASYARGADDASRAVRVPLPALRPFLWSHSFSSITRRHVLDSLESPASDEADAELRGDTPTATASADARLLALNAWGGKQFGVAVHALLETGRGAQPAAAMIARQIAKSGVKPGGADAEAAFTALADMLWRAREADLGDGLRLAALRDADCVAEFAFQFPVAASLAALHAACAAHGAADIWPERISTPELNGMLNGFADLIFFHGGRYHVLDYKTNRLGERLSDYGEASMQAAMDAHRYPLQALIYTVALHRYLRQRLPNYAPQQHLGDSWYLFLRGVGLAPGAGVWRRRWPVALIEALDAAFSSARLAA
ncbi:MAG: UvrD-helicase domain-containing protein [Proteobacteria bacterium]|nr:UvrD-helicase domain-containing protein [Pseudomonadota bacterium]